MGDVIGGMVRFLLAVSLQRQYNWFGKNISWPLDCVGAMLAAGGVLQCSDILTYFLSYLSCRNTYFVLIDADFCRVSSNETYVWITSSIKLLFNVLFCHFLGFDGCLRHLA